jgi:hypothetical protein
VCLVVSLLMVTDRCSGQSLQPDPVKPTGADNGSISAATVDQHGIRVHRVESTFQAGVTDIRVLMPNRLLEVKRYPVLYVLPVEAGRETRYGDGILEVLKQDLHNRHELIVVAPRFSNLPWCADHPTDARIRQETYFLQVVIPFVEKTYPAAGEPAKRWLLGFSKSGWGAWTLLLRQPDIFGRAAAWDAPLMMQQLGSYGTGSIFATQTQFEQYRPADLLRKNAVKLRDAKRLILTGFGNFRDHHQRAHELLTELAIPHDYRDGPPRKHDWHSGWVAEAVELLVAH